MVVLDIIRSSSHTCQLRKCSNHCRPDGINDKNNGTKHDVGDDTRDKEGGGDKGEGKEDKALRW